MRKALAAIALLCGLAIVANAAVAADAPEARTVTVTGDAEIKVLPDEVVLTIGVESRNPNLVEARRTGDQRMKAVVAAAQAAGVAARDIQTDYLNIEPEYKDYQFKELLGYVHRTTVVLTLRDVAKFEQLVTAVLLAGAERIHGIDFRTSQLRKHRDEARALAIKAAKEKAVALAGELGQKIGRPRSIQEGRSGWVSSYRNWWGRGGQSLSQNVSQAAAGDSASHDGPLAPGSLRVQASVTVAFELE